MKLQDTKNLHLKMNFFQQESLKGVKGVKELSLPPVAKE